MAEIDYLGLQPKVLFRQELGYCFVDDGERLFRFDALSFLKLSAWIRSEEQDTVLPELVSLHPTIFSFYQNVEDAKGTFATAEI